MQNGPGPKSGYADYTLKTEQSLQIDLIGISGLI